MPSGHGVLRKCSKHPKFDCNDGQEVWGYPGRHPVALLSLNVVQEVNFQMFIFSQGDVSPCK